MSCDDFDFGDLLGLGLAIGEEMAEEELERIRIEREFEQDDDDDKLIDDQIRLDSIKKEGAFLFILIKLIRQQKYSFGFEYNNKINDFYV